MNRFGKLAESPTARDIPAQLIRHATRLRSCGTENLAMKRGGILSTVLGAISRFIAGFQSWNYFVKKG